MNEYLVLENEFMGLRQELIRRGGSETGIPWIESIIHHHNQRLTGIKLNRKTKHIGVYFAGDIGMDMQHNNSWLGPSRAG